MDGAKINTSGLERLNDILVAHAQYMLQERGLSEASVHTYGWYVRAFLRACGDGERVLRDDERWLRGSKFRDGELRAEPSSEEGRGPGKWVGTHTLRHSLATTLLKQGASLREIGSVLRHRQVDTTSIYAQVDIDGLRELVQPWPAEVR